jgi:hypothetical protein
VNWAGGGSARYCAVEAFDLNMNYVGTIATGRGHADIAVDKDGSEWYVDFSPDNYVNPQGPIIRKNRIPDGYTAYAAGDTSAIRVLFTVDWSHGMHISGLAHGSGYVIASTFSGSANGWQALENEVFKVYLDSVDSYPKGSGPSSPHVERIAHSMSDYAYVNSNSCVQPGYWAQPHATVRRDGKQILFGSTWGANCVPESYVIQLGPSSNSSQRIGDLNGDGVVNISDLLMAANSIGKPTAGNPADLNKDGRIDLYDLMVIMKNWGK